MLQGQAGWTHITGGGREKFPATNKDKGYGAKDQISLARMREEKTASAEVPEDLGLGGVVRGHGCVEDQETAEVMKLPV